MEVDIWGCWKLHAESRAGLARDTVSPRPSLSGVLVVLLPFVYRGETSAVHF